MEHSGGSDPLKTYRIPLGSPADPHPDPQAQTPVAGLRNPIPDPLDCPRGSLRSLSGVRGCATSLRAADETAPQPDLADFEIVPSSRAVCYRQAGNVGTNSVSLKMTVYTHARGLTLQRARGQERRDRRHLGSSSFHQGRQLPQRSFLWTPVPRMPPGEQGRGRSRLRQKTTPRAGASGPRPRRRLSQQSDVAARACNGLSLKKKQKLQSAGQRIAQRRAAAAGGGGGRAFGGPRPHDFPASCRLDRPQPDLADF